MILLTLSYFNMATVLTSLLLIGGFPCATNIDATFIKEKLLHDCAQYFNFMMNIEWGSSVRIGTGKEFLSSPPRPHWLRGPLVLVSNGFKGLSSWV
jgi:hypothetical protein